MSKKTKAAKPKAAKTKAKTKKAALPLTTGKRVVVDVQPVRGTGGVLVVHPLPGIDGVGSVGVWGISQSPSGLSVSADRGFDSAEEAYAAALDFWGRLDEPGRAWLRSTKGGGEAPPSAAAAREASFAAHRS